MIDTVPAVLARARELVVPSIAACQRRLSPELREVLDHHFGWGPVDDATGGGGARERAATSSGSGRAERPGLAPTPPPGDDISHDGHAGRASLAYQATPLTYNGKAIRPALAVLSAEAVGAAGVIAVPGAVAIELVHNFSLIHDDIIDNDVERRHRPTAWAAFGVGPAICAGDALLALAVQVLLEPAGVLLEPAGVHGSADGRDARNGRHDQGPGIAARAAAVAALLEATQKMIAGQTLDIAFEGRPEISTAAYERMAAGKTGAILAGAASIGAVLAGAPPTTSQALATYGAKLGLAFQAVDDILGIWGEPEVTGKPIGSDLRQRKASLPIVAALELGGSASRQLRELLTAEVPSPPAGPSGAPDADAATERLVRDGTALIEATGARQYTQDRADHWLSEALAALDRVAVAPTARAELEELARFITARTY